MAAKKAVSKKLLGLVETPQQIPVLDDFMLVGGTALALQMGHRMSDDIDLFTLNSIDQNFIRLVQQPTLNTQFKINNTADESHSQ